MRRTLNKKFFTRTLYEGLFHEDVEVAKIHVIILNKFAVNKTGFSFP